MTRPRIRPLAMASILVLAASSSHAQGRFVPLLKAALGKAKMGRKAFGKGKSLSTFTSRGMTPDGGTVSRDDLGRATGHEFMGPLSWMDVTHPGQWLIEPLTGDDRRQTARDVDRETYLTHEALRYLQAEAAGARYVPLDHRPINLDTTNGTDLERVVEGLYAREQGDLAEIKLLLGRIDAARAEHGVLPLEDELDLRDAVERREREIAYLQGKARWFGDQLRAEDGEVPAYGSTFSGGGGVQDTNVTGLDERYDRVAALEDYAANLAGEEDRMRAHAATVEHEYVRHMTESGRIPLHRFGSLPGAPGTASPFDLTLVPDRGRPGGEFLPSADGSGATLPGLGADAVRGFSDARKGYWWDVEDARRDFDPGGVDVFEPSLEPGRGDLGEGPPSTLPSRPEVSPW